MAVTRALRTVGAGIAGALAVAALPLQSGCSGAPSSAEDVGTTSAAVDTICNEQPSATLDGFPAYAYCGNFNVWTDNGIDTRSTSGGSGWVQTEGGYGYQCVEWAVRYFYFKWNVPRNWFVGYAKDMCSTYPSGVSKTSNPVHGDLAVFTPGCAGADATAGHVAAIDTVASTTISVVQQNPAGTMTWPKSCVMCYLHAAANGSASDPCATAKLDGLYCGQSPQWGGGTPNVLYDCAGGVTKSKTPCQYGCHLAPYGQNDSCNPAPPDAGAGDGGKGATDAGPIDSGATQDDAGPTAPPSFGDDASDEAGDDAGNGDAPSAPTASSGGCSVSNGGRGAPGTGAGVLGGSLALVAMAMTRRRRRSRD